MKKHENRNSSKRYSEDFTHVNTERRQTEAIRRPALLSVNYTVEEELHQAGDIAEEGLHPLVDLLAIEVLQQVAVAFLRGR